MHIRLAAVAVAALTMAGASAAVADDYTFSFKGTDDSTLTFGINSSDAYTTLSNGIEFTGVKAQFNGKSKTDIIDFYNTGGLGGFEATNSNNGNVQEDTTGAQLYKLPASGLVFKTGTFDLAAFGTGSSGTLDITDTTVSSAPEPGTWALMMLGVGAIGAMLGYRKRVLVDHKAKLAAVG